jgi:TRAP transporter TAXI family solute receptor
MQGGFPMKLNTTILALGVALALLAFAQAQTPTYQLTLAGASPGGLWSLLGVGIDRAFTAAYPGSTVTYQTSGGGIANVQLLEQKKVPLGIVHNVELRMAQNGEAPFRAPVKDLQVIANLYNWAPIQLVITKDFAEKYGIKRFEDIAAKKPPLRVATNRQGNISSMVVDRMFDAIGVTPAEIETWGGKVVLAASEEQADLLRDRRIDAIFNALFVGHRSLIEVGQAINVVMVPVGDATANKVEQATGAGTFVVPANSYPWQPEPAPAVSLGALLVVHPSMSEAEAYAITKALVEHVDQIQAVHPSMKALTPKFMTEQKVAPYHPGAIKYYKEKGLMTGS